MSSRFGGKLAQRREHAEQYSKGDFNTVLCSFTVPSTRLCTVRRRRAVLAMRDGYLSTCCDWVQQVRQRCFERSFKCLGCGSRWVGAFSEGRFAPHQCCHHVSAAAVLHPSQCCPMPVTVLVLMRSPKLTVPPRNARDRVLPLTVLLLVLLSLTVLSPSALHIMLCYSAATLSYATPVLRP